MRDPARRLARTVFELEGEPYSWLDVLLAADARGDWPPLERAIRAGLAAEDHASEDDVKAALVAFRLRLDLAAAEDAERWLERFDLDRRQWSDAVRRALARSRRREEADPAAGGAASSIPFEVWWADAVVTGVLEAWARRAAEDLAVAALHPAPAAAPADPANAAALSSASWLASQPGASSRWTHLAGVVARARVIEAAALTAEAIRTTLAAHPLEWTWLVIELLAFPAEAAAREALLCHRLEGEPFADLAKRSGQRLHVLECRLEDLPAQLRTPCVGARGGEALGPLAVDGGFSVLRVVRREPPSPDLPAAVARAREEIVGQLRRKAVRDRVRFLLPVAAP